MSLDDDLPDDVSFILNTSEPSDELLETARQLLGESPDSRVCALQELEDMIYERGDVVPLRMDATYLTRFLRARHFNVEKAHQLLVKYYKFRDNNPEYVKGVSPWDEMPMLIAKEEIISVLPYRDQLGRRTMLFKLGKWNPNECSVDDLFKTTLMLLETAVLEQRAQIVGGVCFFDMENLSLQQAWQITPAVADKVIQLMGGSFPIRVPEIHIVNQPWVFETVFAMFKPFLDERMSSRIHFHGSDFETLHSFIEPKYLPEIYGGTRPHYPNTRWLEKLATLPNILKDLKSTGYNISDDRITQYEDKSKTHENEV